SLRGECPLWPDLLLSPQRRRFTFAWSYGQARQTGGILPDVKAGAFEHTDQSQYRFNGTERFQGASISMWPETWNMLSNIPNRKRQGFTIRRVDLIIRRSGRPSNGSGTAGR